MITFAEGHLVPELKTIWKTCFGDSDEYIDLFFEKKFKPQNTLIYIDKNKVVAYLQMQEYNIRMYDQVFPFYYMVGLCTLPEYRGKGYMSRLIEKSFDVMQRRRIPLSILVPAEDSLLKYYNQFEYEETFDRGTKKIELEKILKENQNISDAFDVFDQMYQQNDFCVLKNIEDFEVIATDYKMGGYPARYNLKAMSKILDQKRLLSYYAIKNNNLKFIIQTQKTSSKQDIFYLIENGSVKEITKIDQEDRKIIVDDRFLTKLLFGYKIAENKEYSDLFDQHKPIINLMLE